jgi:hypothetical protein
LKQRSLGRILLFAGAAILLFAGWAAAQYRGLTVRGPFFAAPFGIAVAEDGTIFVGANFADVHAYDRDGAPVRGWRVPASAGVFRLHLASPQRLLVAPYRTGELLEYDLLGNLVSSKRDPGAYERLGPLHDHEFVTPDGVTLVLTSKGLVRVSPAPETVLVPGPSWPLYALGPQPLVALIALLNAGSIGLVVGVVLTSRTRLAH